MVLHQKSIKYGRAYIWVVLLSRNLRKVVYKKLEKQAPFALDQLKLLSDQSAIESAIEIHVRHKETVSSCCAKSHSQRNTGRPVENYDRFARKVQKTSARFITCDFHNPLSSKSQTLDGPILLDHKNNPLGCWKKSLKRLDKQYS